MLKSIAVWLVVEVSCDESENPTEEQLRSWVEDAVHEGNFEITTKQEKLLEDNNSN